MSEFTTSKNKKKLGQQIRGDYHNPYHLSVGQIVVDSQNRIALIRKPHGPVTLPRETAFSKESSHQVAIRGAAEELGKKIKVTRFLGSLIIHFIQSDKTKVEKTTLYFLTKVSGTTSKDLTDDELDNEIIWTSPPSAIKKLKKSNNIEYKIVERYREIGE